MDIPNKKNVIFGYFVNNEFMGARSDSFGHISKQFPKIYTYSPEQVEIIKKNVKEELSHSGSGFLDLLFGKDEEITQELKASEDEKRKWGEFEIRVIEFPISREEWYDMCTPGEEYKRKGILDNLGEILEIHKFKTLTNEN
jgi:hypothetical protein